MKRLMLLALPLLLAGPAAQAKTNPTNLKWMDGPPGLPSGAKFAVVSGDPGKEGPFVIRIKMPANYAVPAHHHPTDERVTILSGRAGYGMSDKLDRAKARTATSGQSLTMKAGMNHWVFTRSPATLQVSSTGPFQIVYADPKDDPRK